MPEKIKNKMSFRMRVTLITGTTLVLVSILISFTIIYNAGYYIIGPAKKVTEDGEMGVASSTGIGDEYAKPVNPEGMDVAEEYAIHVTNFYNYTVVAIVVVILIGIIVLYIVTGISLKPLKDLQKDIANIDAKDLSKRITEFSTGDELDALARSFNKMLDKIQDAFEREKSFSTGAAHELKTPLAVIKTNLDVLQMSDIPSTEEYEETITVVKNQTERMTKLVEDLFAMCALKGYETDDTIHVDSLIKEIISEHKDDAKERNITIDVEGATCKVIGNIVMLKHAISNIIQNALKYNINGGSINISVSEKFDNCQISIADTGIGIDCDAAKHIFEPFYREDKSRSRKIGGAGLGLSIVKSIIEQHGGTVKYKPNNPKGSIFIIILPINK